MSDVKIEINRTETGGTFTNHDIIRGTVTLTVTSSISLNYIQVKLEGMALTEMAVPYTTGRKGKEREKMLHDVHRVLYDTNIIFPPDNIRKVSQAKEFTLTPGNYTYPFEFKIPLNNSCVKRGGITNKVQFNRKNFDLVINNGNFNAAVVKNAAQSMLASAQGRPSPGDGAGGARPQGRPSPGESNHVRAQPPQQQPYHITCQLPPSLLSVGLFARIDYFVKVTCKRSSVFKLNLRATDPFIFLPLDLDAHNQPLFLGGDFEEYREVFFRKELVFYDRIPEIVGVKMPDRKPLPSTPPPPPRRNGFLLNLFGSPYSSSSAHSPGLSLGLLSKQYPEITASTVPFYFEIRFRHPAFLVPTKPPSFKLLLVSNVKPSRYSLAQYGKPDESNGLGVVYMQKLVVELTSSTVISVLETDGSFREIHEARHEKKIPIIDNVYNNLKFDLVNCKKQKTSSNSNSNVYELEIPREYYENCVLPDDLSPSFRTCNIVRKYSLSVVGGFTAERINHNDRTELKKIKYVDLACNDIKVLSGLNLTSNLHSNSKTSLSGPLNQVPASPTAYIDEKFPPPSPEKPQLPTRPSVSSSVHLDMGYHEDVPTSGPLPTYEDVVRESMYQDDSEHQRARRRYRQ